MSTKPNILTSSKPINAAEIPISNPQGVSAIYANNVGLAATLMDFTLLFLVTGQFPGDNGPVAKNELRAAVTLPLPAAAALIQVLQQYLLTSQERLKAASDLPAKAGQGSGKQ